MSVGRECVPRVGGEEKIVEDQRFDELTRRFARPISRRQAFKVLVVSLVGGAFAGLSRGLTQAATCPSGQTNCRAADGTPHCVNTSTDTNNCGACKTQCPKGATCVNGTCKCPPSQVTCKGEEGSFCAKKCCAYDAGDCGDVPSRGAFSISVPDTRVKLTGVGTPHTSGSVVSVARVAAPHLPKHAQAFKLAASGHIPPLKLATKGSLSQLIVSHSKWKSIEAITGSGIYAAFLG